MQPYVRTCCFFGVVASEVRNLFTLLRALSTRLINCCVSDEWPFPTDIPSMWSLKDLGYSCTILIAMVSKFFQPGFVACLNTSFTITRTISDLWLGLGSLSDLHASNKAGGNLSQGTSKLCIQSESSSRLLLLLRALLNDRSDTGIVLVPDVLPEISEIHKT